MTLEREKIYLHQISELRGSLDYSSYFFFNSSSYPSPFLIHLKFKWPSLQLSLVLLSLLQLPDEAYSKRKQIHTDLITT